MSRSGAFPQFNPTPFLSTMNVKIEEGWKEVLQNEFETFYFKSLTDTVRREYASLPNQVFPAPGRIFAAFDSCPFSKVKVVIIGQDPYHGPGQANGLSFSVNPGIPFPPSLRNIFKEISSDLGVEPPVDGDLTRWANQGVLLLNSTLTVRAHTPKSHSGIGWEQFTDAAVDALNKRKENLVFLLWGADAIKKGSRIDRERHLVLTAPHPSPLSASRGFFGCRHFSKTNAWLKEHGMKEIEW